MEQFEQGRQRAAHGFGARGKRFVHAKKSFQSMWWTWGSSRMSACLDHEGSSGSLCADRKRGSNIFTTCSEEEKEELAALEPTFTPSTQPSLILAAAAVGTGATMQPSASKRPSYSTGLTRPGKAQLARMATSSGPLVKM